MRRQSEALRLAEELLADIELSRMGAEQLLLKASRLARLINDEDTQEWVGLELHGYKFTKEARPYLARSERITKDNDGNEKAWCQSLGRMEAVVRAQELRMQSLQSTSLSGEMLLPALSRHHANIAGAANTIADFSAIRSAVVAGLHSFASATYYELYFGQSQETLFEAARREIDALLAPLGGQALEKIESITERLAAGNSEAVSQAMSTCRRLIDRFADAVYPPADVSVVRDGQQIEIKKSNVLNRINLYIVDNSESASRRHRLKQVLRGIYERVSAGVHDDVSPSEARFLFLETYVVLGEILTVKTGIREEPGSADVVTEENVALPEQRSDAEPEPLSGA